MTEVRVIIRSEAQGRTFGKNLASIIDVECIRKLETRSRSDQRVQVLHRAAVFPHEGVEKIVTI